MFNPLLALPPGQHNMEMPWHDTMQDLGMKGQQPDINSVFSIPSICLTAGEANEDHIGVDSCP